MLFNSYAFIFAFFPIVSIVYFCLGHRGYHRLTNGWMFFSSLIFYSYWDIRYLPLLLFSIGANYFFSGIILKKRKEAHFTYAKTILRLGLAFNIGLLCFFKYTDFLIENFNVIVGSQFSLLHIILPLGISFFSITQMVYLIDCYEGLAKEHDLLNYSLFVLFFPHLLAGPILHHKPIMRQFSDAKNHLINWENIGLGLTLFIIGLFKKVVIADSFINYVHMGFNNVEQLTLFDSWLTVICYAFQMYFDFSGYSDMAVGIARVFNISIPINFNSPYKAVNIIDYWKRWHISLTDTITTYLYMPILRSFTEVTFAKAMFATFVAMFIAGIWHGAGWTFIIFGSMHALGLVVNHMYRQYKLKMPTILARAVTMIWVLLAFVFFRANTVQEAWIMIKAMFGMKGIVVPFILQSYFPHFQEKWYEFGRLQFQNADLLEAAVMSIFCFAMVTFSPNSNSLLKKVLPTTKWTVAAALLCAWALISIYSGVSTEFLYFQF